MFSIQRHDTPPPAPAPQGIFEKKFAVEWRLLKEAAKLGFAMPRLSQLPKGDGPVILVPGWKAPEWTMSPMRTFLRQLGWEARHWGLGINKGDPEGDCEKLKTLIQESYARDPRPVALVGWSLGGVIAREMARHLPELVYGVVTYGTPVIGGPSYTLGAMYFDEKECERARILVETLDRDLPIQTPMTCIFSKQDQIVSWPACIDRISPKVTHFEVNTPHIAMGLNPAVWHTIASQLHEYRCALTTKAAARAPSAPVE